MRARGARVTDIAILVVAADDGVMPQTIEALNHAQAANVPIVVAVNKVDKEGANPAKIRQQLTEYNLVAEEYGGDTIFVDVSALKGLGIHDLLEAVLLTADAGLDLRANPNKDARGVAVEAHLDKGRGAVATVLVQSGTLRVGDAIVAGTAHGRVRAMFDEHDELVEEALPARPVMVIGLTSVPRAGDTFLVADDDRTARQIAEKREAADRAAQLAKRRKRISLEDFNQGPRRRQGRHPQPHHQGRCVRCRRGARGRAARDRCGRRTSTCASSTVVWVPSRRTTSTSPRSTTRSSSASTCVPPSASRSSRTARASTCASTRSSTARSRTSRRRSRACSSPSSRRRRPAPPRSWRSSVSSKFGNIAGCLVREGTIKRNAKVRVTRGGNVIGEATIDTLRRFKDDATEVREGFECGIGLGKFNDIQVGDLIETFEMVEIPRT